jgi:threonine/homoserine/homoserine lactone efflux protein
MGSGTGLALAAFVVAMVGSPGPANIALMGAGAAVGFRAALPFLVGTITGFVALATVLAFGLSDLLARFPPVKMALLAAGTMYLCWLAYRLWHARPSTPTEGAAAPGFAAGLLVHPLNPKAWAMLVAAFGQFVPAGGDAWTGAIAVVLAFVVLGTPLNAIWCAGGSLLAEQLHRPASAAWLNRGLAILLLTSVALSLPGAF